MSYWTTFQFNAVLKKSTPRAVLDLLTWMLESDGLVKGPTPTDVPDTFKPLLATERAHRMLYSSNGYPARFSSSMSVSGDDLVLSVFCQLKNYDREIELFLETFAPYFVVREGFMGFIEPEDGPTTILYGAWGGEHDHIRRHTVEWR